MRYGNYHRKTNLNQDPTNPSEDTEQIKFCEWLDTQRIPYWHTNNEMWTQSWKQKARAKAMGVKSGIPDLFIVLEDGLVGIEMKRKKNGVVSPTQYFWAELLEKANVPVYVCRGADNAIETVEHLLKDENRKKLKIEETYEEFLSRKKLEKIKKNMEKRQIF